MSFPNTRTTLFAAPLVAVLLLGCGESDTLAPEPRFIALELNQGDGQFGVPGASVLEPLTLRAADTRDGSPIEGLTIMWEITSGQGAQLDPTKSRTDASGLARSSLRLGSQLGNYVVSASVVGKKVLPLRFQAAAVDGPVVESMSTPSANAGDTIVITGRNFSSRPLDNTVLFDGVQGSVLSAAPNQLRVVIPACLPSRTVNVVVALGSVAGAAAHLSMLARVRDFQQLSPGQVITLSSSAARCIQLPAQANALYLLVPQYAARAVGELRYQLLGLGEQAPPTAARPRWELRPELTNDAMRGIGADWHLRIRARELTAPNLNVSPRALTATAPVKVGDRTRFFVLNKLGSSVTVQAEVKLVSAHAVFYQEVGVAGGGFTSDEFQEFARVFEDPIYPTDTKVYGLPSDLDGDGRVAILFTSIVNEITDRAEQGFVAGFFDPCDLMTEQQCYWTNQREIFYALVPDPAGVYSKPHTPDELLRKVPPVLAHEFMHMIHYNQRMLLQKAPVHDDVWLQEALAHMAEDTVAGVLLERGDLTRAAYFLGQNYVRAYSYLTNPGDAPLLFNDMGSLASRGAVWLLLRYLIGHVPGNVLQDLTRSTRTGIANVEYVSGMKWSELLQYWGVALWADDAPELGSVRVDRRYTYTNMNLREALGTAQSAFGFTYGLRPERHGFADFLSSGTITAGSQSYLLVDAGASPQPLALNLTGPRGVELAANTPVQVAILRIR